MPWESKVLRSADYLGVTDRVNEIARDYRDGVRVLRYPDPYGSESVRVERGSLGTILSPEGVVLGFTTNPAELRATQHRAASPRKRKRGGKRGPQTPDELREWLVEGGCEVTLGGTGHYQVRRDGQLLGTYANTASDRRSLANAAGNLRKTTGLRLRK